MTRKPYFVFFFLAGTGEFDPAEVGTFSPSVVVLTMLPDLLLTLSRATNSDSIENVPLSRLLLGCFTIVIFLRLNIIQKLEELLQLL